MERYYRFIILHMKSKLYFLITLRTFNLMSKPFQSVV